jgi:protein-tyrosine phosphatase
MRSHLKLAGLAGEVAVDSAGTRTSQPGARPDQRAQRVAAAAGVTVGQIRARRVTQRDFLVSDMILAMDGGNLRDLKKNCPPELHHKISLLLSHNRAGNLDEVPDPYYGSYEGFVEVFKIIDEGVISLLPHMGTLGQIRDPAVS